ncbi:MAG: hypothetical protein GC156_08855 [Actinomycetales bacterium]|nr:hypothetical protein [Actinomycetales bacterium]
MKTYRVTALGSALVRMWRAWSVILPVVIVNALLQGALVPLATTPASEWLLVVAAVVSAVAFVLSYGTIAAAALEVPFGRVGWRRAMLTLRPRLLPFLVWALGLLIIVVAGLAIHLAVALLLVGLTAFLLLAVLDGRPQPLKVNFQTIGRRIWRWLVTGVVVVVLVLVGIMALGMMQFFLRGFLGAAVGWLLAGLVIAWLITTRALLYRSAWALSEPVDPAEDELAAPTPDLA